MSGRSESLNIEDYFSFKPPSKVLKDAPTERADEDKDSSNKEYKEICFSGLKVSGIKSSTTSFPLRPYMKQKLIPRPCFSLLFIGGTGSGKTTLLANLVNNKDMYKDYFDEIIVFGGSVKSDGMYEYIKYDSLYEDNFIEHVENLLKKAENEPKHKKKKRLVIFEDVSGEKKLLASGAFRKIFCQNRHYFISVIALSHKLKAVTRLCRLQCHGVFLFPCDNSEIKQAIESFAPPKKIMDRKTFEELIEYAHEPDEDMERPFLFINKQVPFKDRFRKGFDIIQLEN